MKNLNKYAKISACTILVIIAAAVAESLGARDLSDPVRAAANTDTVSFRIQRRHVFPKSAPNEIVDRNNEMHRFFGRLNAVKSRDREIKTVSIVHLGDSHIQADFMTCTVRKLMNLHFGNPGRGLIAPNRLMKSNNGRNYRMYSDNIWKHSFVVRPNSIPIGIAGLGLQVRDSTASVRISTAGEEFPGEWDFNSVTVFGDFESADVGTDGAHFPFDSSVCSRTLRLDTLTSEISLNFSSTGRGEINFFGCSLANGRHGVFYHSIGINGARCGDFCSHETLFSQMTMLKPELVIISFGTNESMAKYVSEAALYASLSDIIYHVNRLSPDLTVMLTTPAETYTRNRAAPNIRAEKVRNVIVRFAETHGLPYWDLYRITGGKGSAVNWNKKRLMARDKIHLTPAGYEYQGELLFEAVMKSYNSYIRENS